MSNNMSVEKNQNHQWYEKKHGDNEDEVELRPKRFYTG
jgi:hypothetical protein